MAHMTVNVRREKAISMTLYVPQQGRTEEENEEFFGNVQTEIDNIKSNKEVKRILEICKINRLAINLAVMNTYYQHKEAHIWTWYGWNSKGTYDKQSQIDLFLSSNKNRIRNVKAIPSVSLDSDRRRVLMTTKY